MAVHLVTWDLMKEKNYQSLHDALKNFSSCRIMLSVAVVNTTYTATELREHLKSYIDNDDRLFVAKMNGEWGTTFKNQCTDWLKQQNF